MKVVLFKKNLNIYIGTKCLFEQQICTAGIKYSHNETVLFAYFLIGIKH